MPLGNEVAGLGRQQNCRSWDPNKDRKEVVCKNISGPSRENATHTRHHWKHEHQVTGSRNVSFPAVVKGVSSRRAHHGPGRSTAHRGGSKESKVNRTYKTGGPDEVESTRARINMDRAMEKGPV